MLFLADEDFPGIAVHWLREAGHDVLWARTNMPGEADSALLAAAHVRHGVPAGGWRPGMAGQLLNHAAHTGCVAYNVQRHAPPT